MAFRRLGCAFERIERREPLFRAGSNEGAAQLELDTATLRIVRRHAQFDHQASFGSAGVPYLESYEVRGRWRIIMTMKRDVGPTVRAGRMLEVLLILTVVLSVVGAVLSATGVGA